MPNFVGKIYVIDQKPSPILAVYQCGWQQCGPNHSYGPGIWDHYVIHYIIKGKGEFTYGGNTYPIQAGQGFMISPNTTAYYRADSCLLYTSRLTADGRSPARRWISPPEW